MLRGHHSRVIYSVDWCWHSGLIATAAGDNRLCVLAGEYQRDGSGRSYHVHAQKDQAHAGDVNCARWRPGGGVLASVGDDSIVRLWKVPVEEGL